ncbi:hypothetical protein LX16_1179 [Stackebrandtia albiflava]|uniref:Uncharacterized protein n=1 Tax=Stackebrandtia albiflava TaxID=406432 RepID=A0A562VC63_9ACTN|nr:hypothetical protein [Stackebrandtia albiflava]TWJ15469.1 hypothetical protein LX16_1179 [Stackebrandtia albiflava]
MRTMIGTAGLLLVVQGAGGLINNLFTDSRSWFLLNHVDMPAGLRMAAHLVLLVVGLVLVARTGTGRDPA